MRRSTPEFERMVHTHAADLYRYAYWLSGQRADAEDLVQDCYQRAWRSWSGLRDPHKAKFWLFAILRREFLRQMQRPATATMNLDQALEIAAPQLAVDDVYALRQALTQTPPQLREALLLQVLGGFSCEEIAQLTDTTPGAVMTRVSRARQWLRRYLSPPHKEAQ